MNHPLCANGCGFYGSAEYFNLRFNCYNEYQKQEHEINALASSIAHLSLANENIVAAASSDREFQNQDYAIRALASSMAQLSLANGSRCTCCDNRQGLMGFSCRCGNMFCVYHRLPEDHSCTFDFKTFVFA
ncbi:hypothetical protein GH714_030223 [Hevea brasiliensis]|uniref:AN1-type domain-containing protein n=1 Tax=Hevea brasiliensis TaxID=3981 RepID=A0A6A6N919_HEVBR|nr:hypothetical protein GH714_030223 [Hevea brasiliensis]